jgi:hypothetical protein
MELKLKTIHETMLLPKNRTNVKSGNFAKSKLT